MSSHIEKAIIIASRKILRPLARLLLRNGIAYGSFTEIVRRVFVEVAFEDFAPSGKKQTVSRVSALTGLTRKEVSRIRDAEPDDDIVASQKYNRAIRVISGWNNDRTFLDKTGVPLVLPINTLEPSFTTLVKTYSGDIPTKAMLDVLVTSGSVVKNEDGTVSLIKSAYIPSGDPVDKINILGTDVKELISTIDHNLTSPSEELRFQRKVSYSNIPHEAAQKFRDLSKLKSQSLLEEFNEWLHENQRDLDDLSINDDGDYVSLGIYYYEDSGGKVS